MCRFAELFARWSVTVFTDANDRNPRGEDVTVAALDLAEAFCLGGTEEKAFTRGEH